MTLGCFEVLILIVKHQLHCGSWNLVLSYHDYCSTTFRGTPYPKRLSALDTIMAADTREDSSKSQPSGQQLSSAPTQVNKTYERFNSPAAVPPENANALPGGTLNTAGGRVRNATIVDALRTLKLEDFKELHKKPCARDALLAGIGAGFGMGGLRAIMGGLSSSFSSTACPVRNWRLFSPL